MIYFVPILLLFLELSCISSYAFQLKGYEEGKSWGSSASGDVVGLAKSANPHIIPGFKTDKPKEASLDASTLGNAVVAETNSNDVAQHLVSQSADRKTFKIDPNTDPLFVEANQVLGDPQKTLKEEFKEMPKSNVQEETEICEESGEETLEAGEEVRIVTVTTPPKHKSTLLVYSHGWAGGLSRNMITGQKLDSSTQDTTGYAASTTLYNPLPESLRSRIKIFAFEKDFLCPWYVSLSSSGVINITTSNGGWFWINHLYVPIEFTLKPGEENVQETIDSTCQALEEKVEKGLCSYEEIIVTEGPQTRVINDYPVTRDWWRRKKIYRCHYPSMNTCEALRNKGCYQTNSTCKEKVGNTCVVWQQTYKCLTGKRAGKSYQSSNKDNPFCLTGNCADISYEANNEMMTAMSHLYVLREAQNDLRDFKIIFKGQHRWCTRSCLNFRDCCGNGKGWGVSLHLSSCDKKEQELRTLRDKNLCVQIGTYCAEREKVTKICLRKKTTFCCYGVKAARLIQQSGRAQLGLGWGSVESPDCNGLSPEQLSRIDFSKINFAELFDDIKSQTVLKDQKQSLAKVNSERLQNNMTLLTQPSVDKKTQQDLQKLREKGL